MEEFIAYLIKNLSLLSIFPSNAYELAPTVAPTSTPIPNNVVTIIIIPIIRIVFLEVFDAGENVYIVRDSIHYFV